MGCVLFRGDLYYQIFISIVSLLLFISPSFAGEKLKIAVSDLDAFGVQESLAQSASDILRTELFRTGYFHVMERKHMEKILKEQSFQLSGATEETIIELGRVMAVQLIAIGSMNRLGKQLVLNIRLVDVEEARLKAAETIQASGEEGLPDAIKAMAKKISEVVPLRGKVISIVGDEVLVSLGSMDRITNGLVLKVQRFGEAIKDPTSGKVLGRQIIEVALLRVSKIMGDELSSTAVVEEFDKLQVGDVVIVSTVEEASKARKSIMPIPSSSPPQTSDEPPHGSQNSRTGLLNQIMVSPMDRTSMLNMVISLGD